MYSLLLHSHFLQSLGNAIIYSLWQSLLFLLLYKIILIFSKELKPAIKHNLSALFVVLTLIWFVFTFQKNLFQPATSSAGILTVFGDPQITRNSLISIPAEIATTLSAGYLLLLAFLLSRLFFSIGKTIRVKASQLLPVDSGLLLFTRRTATFLNIRKEISVWIGKNISIPSTIGFFKPVILLPAVCITNLSTEQVEAIILHELSHIKRNDFIINIFLVITETILFFNPCVYIFMQIIRREREHCCDDLVLENNYEPLRYAKALLSIGKQQELKINLAMNAVSGKYQLLNRIKRITGANLQKSVNFPARLATYGFLVVLLFSFSMILPHMKNMISHKKSMTAIAEIKTSYPLIAKEEIQLPLDVEGQKKEIRTIAGSTGTNETTMSREKMESAPSSSQIINLSDIIDTVTKAMKDIDWQQISSQINDKTGKELKSMVMKSNILKEIAKTNAVLNSDQLKNAFKMAKEYQAFFNDAANVQMGSDSLSLFRESLDKKVKDQVRQLEIQSQDQRNQKSIFLEGKKSENRMVFNFLRTANI